MWKDIEGYEGYYEINNNGDIRNKNTGRILKPGLRGPQTKNCLGYKFVVLCRNPQDHQKHNVHRLVAQNFVENPNNYPIVMHKDNNTMNCSADNLEWGTILQNTRNAHRDGLCDDAREKVIYDIYNENGDSVICRGYKETLSTIQSPGTSPGIITSKVSRKHIISKGPYKGYKIRKLVKGITYNKNVQRSSLDEGGKCLNVESQAGVNDTLMEKEKSDPFN